MDKRAEEINELMQDQFGFHLKEELWSQPVTNDTLRQACQQMLMAISVGLAEVEKRRAEQQEAAADA